jgi:hypothetical protein
MIFHIGDIMNKWSEIKQATLDKLFMDEDEARQQKYLEKFQACANECLNLIANGVKPRIVAHKFTVIADDKPVGIGEYHLGDIITMPDDFLSFADMIVLHNNAPYDDVVYLGDRDVTVGELGDYVIYYNGLWEPITEEHVDPMQDKPLDIHLSVVNCLPSYIASKVLAQDDIQRSTILNNEFELSLSRLDTNIMYQNNHYRSSGGWY